MGAFQSKVWTEVSSSGSPGSPSESKPVGDNEKPKAAPFRDPRSISDDVERTPIQIAAEKRLKKIAAMGEDSKENVMPTMDQTPTGPSLAGRFKAASIDPRSPGGQDLTRTPIVLKNQDNNDTTEKENGIKGLGKNEDVTPKPKRGMAAFVDKLVESTEIEELLQSTAKMDLEPKEQEKNLHSNSNLLLDPEETKEVDIENESPNKSTTSDALIEAIETLAQSEMSKNEDEHKTSTLASDSNDSSIEMSSNAEDILSPTNNRCGKKTMFPMVIGYQEAKSPRSPLGQLNLNPKFLPTSVLSDSTNLKASGDSGVDASNNLQDFKPNTIQFDKEMIENLPEHENENDENRSLVI